MLYVIGAVVLLIIIVIVWGRMSVSRGLNQRDERILKLLDPIGLKLDEGQPVTLEEVRKLAHHPEVRYILFKALRDMQRPDLLPTEFNSAICQAESALAYWLMHPNEMKDPPARIEFVETVTRTLAGKTEEFHVFRYRMPDGHWAANAWLLGFAGPMPAEEESYFTLPGAFSRGDEEDKVAPAEIVDWYIDMLRKKGVNV